MRAELSAEAAVFRQELGGDRDVRSTGRYFLGAGYSCGASYQGTTCEHANSRNATPFNTILFGTSRHCPTSSDAIFDKAISGDGTGQNARYSLYSGAERWTGGNFK